MTAFITRYSAPSRDASSPQGLSLDNFVLFLTGAGLALAFLIWLQTGVPACG